jgi:mannose-1-phosphate guanylyltransferase
VVLAGGVGSRFWPLSTAARPKQFLPLAGPRPLLAESVARILPLVPPERVIVVTSAALQTAARATLPELPAAHVLAEPYAASTAPALAWATSVAHQRDPEASVLSLHADWTVADDEAFREAARQALEVAEREGFVLTVGARPSRAEIGYGYIVPGEPVAGGKARRIVRFVEKPSPERAGELIATGALWNTGLFAWTARRLREELREHTPELAASLEAFDRGDPGAAYHSAQPVSIDVGLYERTSRGAVVAGDFGWDDVGSWAALERVRTADPAGNVAVGERCLLVDASGCVVWSDEGTTVLYGVADVVVVRCRGTTLVTTKDRAPELKRLLDRLPPELAGERGA